LFDRKKNISKEIWIIILLEEFWGKINPEEKKQIKKKTEQGIIKHNISYLWSSSQFTHL